MSTTRADDKKYFNIDVFGDYFVAGAQGNTVKPFPRVTLRLRVWENCQNIVRKHVLPKLLRDADPGFASMRKCVVEQVTTSNGEQVYGLPLAFMSRIQISAEARSKGLPLRVDMYPDIVDLRGKLRKARANPDKFKKEEIRHSAAYNKIGDAMDLNKDVFTALKTNSDEQYGRSEIVDAALNAKPGEHLADVEAARKVAEFERESNPPIPEQAPVSLEQANAHNQSDVVELPAKDENEDVEYDL